MNSQKALLLKGVKTGTSLRFIYDIIATVVDIKAITMIPSECETCDGSAIVEMYNLCDTEAAYTFISTIRECAKIHKGCLTCYLKGEKPENDKGWRTTEITFTVTEFPHFARWRTEFPRPPLGDEDWIVERDANINKHDINEHDINDLTTKMLALKI